MSSLLSNNTVGYKLGLRRKPFGSDWDPEGHAPPSVGEATAKSIMRYTRGETLLREEMPEAAAVWDEKSFLRVRDIFAVGGFYCVKGALSEFLARFDLGDGGLVPFPIFKADMKTPYPEEFFLLNFGCRKNTLVPEKSEKVSKFVVEKKTGIQYWKVDEWVKGPVAMSSEALGGGDLWVEEVLYNKFFVSDALVQAITEIGLQGAFALEECLIVEDAS